VIPGAVLWRAFDKTLSRWALAVAADERIPVDIG